MNAEIIGVGTELLLGQIVNTNAQYLSRKLSEIGINVFFHTVVGDNRTRILETLKIAAARSDLIITTGGLGPTMDDLTKETVAEFLGLKLKLHAPSENHIRKFFEKRNRTITDNNLKQAFFPEGSKILPNENGTAPGAMISNKGKTYIILPGPPYELEPMFENYVIPYLEMMTGQRIVSKVLKIFGMGESMVEEKIKDLLIEQSNPTIAPLAQYGEVTLRLTAKCSRPENGYLMMQPIERKIRRRLGDVIYGYNEDQLETVVASLLKEKNKTVSIAESCTGGLISDLLTNIPGISKHFKAGMVTYSNESKIKHLNVNQQTLITYGAVSEQTASEMALGIAEAAEVDIGLAVTGIAGPDGGSAVKPVGLVYIAIASGRTVKVEKYLLNGDRVRIKYTAAKTALDLLRRILYSM